MSWRVTGKCDKKRRKSKKKRKGSEEAVRYVSPACAGPSSRKYLATVTIICSVVIDFYILFTLASEFKGDCERLRARVSGPDGRQETGNRAEASARGGGGGASSEMQRRLLTNSGCGMRRMDLKAEVKFTSCSNKNNRSNNRDEDDGHDYQ